MECYLPNKDKYKIGVIWPVSGNTDLDRVKEMVAQQYKIYSIERLKKNTSENGWVPSSTLKLVFEEPELPKEIILGHSYYRVQPYVSMPLQCYRCQRIGHTAKGCRAKIRCMVCSGEHVKEVCTANEEKCANCGGNHKANAKGCIHIKKATEVEIERAYGTVPQSITGSAKSSQQRDATSLQALSICNDYSGIHQVARPLEVTNNRPSYSAKVMAGGMQRYPSAKTTLYRRNEGKDVKEAGTQTEPLVMEKPCKCNISEDFFRSLKEAFLEVLMKRIDKNNSDIIVEEAITKNFSIQNLQQSTSNSVDESGKRYNTRQHAKEGNKQLDHRPANDIEEDSQEEGVLSSSESENNSIYETVEKRQMKVDYMKALRKEDLRQSKNQVMAERQVVLKKKSKSKKKQ